MGGGQLAQPCDHSSDGDDLLVTAARGSDLWQTTYYGFQRDTGHALLAPFHPGQAVEYRSCSTTTCCTTRPGLLVRVDERTWVKAGVEISDGVPQLAAVVTHGVSDWSTSEVADWAGHVVTIRASWARDALVLRAGTDAGWRMFRLVPFPAASATAGPYCCAPEREGLTVRFTDWRVN